jgi:hyperosmotically inducible protein
MKISTWIALLAVTAFAIACDRNSGGTDESTYSGSGSSSSTNNIHRSSQSSAILPDNTGRNVRDRDDSTLTPGDQGETEADREITRRFRRALTENPEFSVTAQNIKIITVNGKVTLRGPVNTEQERKLIDSIARQQGISSVDNQLEVKGTTQ